MVCALHVHWSSRHRSWQMFSFPFHSCGLCVCEHLSMITLTKNIKRKFTCCLLLAATVGFQNTVYTLSSGQSSVSVCVTVHRPTGTDCPIQFPFDMRFQLVGDDTNGKFCIIIPIVVALNVCFFPWFRHL